ncbi:hypothetical protein MEBOL_002348 [Melittangium boletus DSM 14713]|uniref:Uncharacterized protein n=1 Tax=Melittangium boletus DSM 14713 TaxID=1294270 RepID=A0A250IAK6_9BACT|nr:hypothetical protein MEBOL_002348 [Melittangium boletus DSM 14713]
MTFSALMKKPTNITLLDVDFSFDDEISSGSYQFTEANVREEYVNLAMPNKASTLLVQIKPPQRKR